MKGPYDEVVGADGIEEVAPAEEAEEVHEAAGGGKALLRLLEVLERSGYEEAAVDTVALAVPDAEREEFAERATMFTATPTGEPAVIAEPTAEEGLRGEEAAPAADVAGVVAEQVASEYLEVGERLGPPSGTGPQWRALGPWTIPNGQTYGSSRVNVSGRLSSVVVDPSNPAHVLVGAANGGVWESRDRGASWAPRTDYAATLTVGALAFDRRSPSTVYCGTGEGNWWWFLGAGVLRSTDGGTTWATLCTAPFVGQGFFDLVVDPGNSRHLLAGTTGGLYVSNDGGVTWTRRRSARTWSVAIAPKGGATAEILAACSDGVFRSTNGGTTWTAVALGGSPGSFDRLEVAIAPSSPGIAYAWGSRAGTPYLWRRAGGAWTGVAPPPGVSTAQAWYDWFLAVSPDRANQIYCGAIEVHRGDFSGTAWTWRNITNKGATGDSIHPDQHAIAFEPGNPATIYVANDGGLYRSPDRGITWAHCNNGLVITEFEYLGHDPGSSRRILGGTQDNGTERWTGSHVWEHVADGDGGDCGINRTNPLTVFHTFFGMRLERSGNGGGWGSWTNISPPVPGTEGSLFYPPFECSATNGDTVALGGDRVYVSRANGGAWVALAFPGGGRASSMYIPNADNVYVGTTDGRVLRARWTGAAWSGLAALTTPRAGAFVSDVYVDPTNLNRMWVTYSRVGGGRVYRSDNGGTSWADRTTAALPNLPLNAIQIDPANANRAWVAADLGVYETLDGGATWRDYSNGLPNMFVGDLLFHQHARVLRAGTRNRGVWEIPVDGWLTQPVCGVQWTGSLAANETRRWFTFNWPATWHMVWTVMPTTPRPGGPQLSWTVQAERASSEYVTYWITVRNLTPAAVSFEGRYCILSRY